MPDTEDATKQSIRSFEPPPTALQVAVNSMAVTATMSVFTIYCLYSEDLKVLATNPACFGDDCTDFGGSDPAFAYISLMAFVLFTTEILSNCIATAGYWNWPDFTQLKFDPNNPKSIFTRIFHSMPGSFYFWLDCLSTLSLIFEIPVLLALFVDPDSNVETADASGTGSGSAVDTAEQARAGKASRAGARAGKVVKIIRMVRLIRLVKLFKYAEQTKQNKSAGKDGQVLPEAQPIDDDEDEEMLPESHVGTEMTERTTKKVIIGVLAMLIAIPNLQADSSDYTKNYSIRLLSKQRVNAARYYTLNSLDQTNWEDDAQYVSLYNSWTSTRDYVLKETKCFSVEWSGFNEDNSDLRDHVSPEVQAEEFAGYKTQEALSLRTAEMNTYSLTNSNNTKITALFNTQEDAQAASTQSVILTSCVIILLGGITMLFTQDVNSKVLKPIETMIELVKEISENPLAKEFKSIAKKDIHNKNDGMETTLILQTITKIAGLMRVGFGEAGAEIIAKNLAKSDSTGMSLLGDGVKIRSIFGFCDIRNFTDTTECLQEEVMLFVNRIAHILHGIVVQCNGAANKNIGDAFLLTWKLHDDRMVKGGTQEYVADQALLSLLKTTAEMARHEDFICNFSSTALSILYERMPGYKCKMGCGLHMGWAVEGAIGSDKKIDASYISPHVNWAEFLESSTKEYGVPVLMSEPFWRLLSPELKKLTRQVDNIKKSASDEVTGLFTYDVNPDFDFKSMTHGGGSNPTRRSQEARNRRTPTLTKKDIGGKAKGRRKTNSLVVAQAEKSAEAPTTDSNESDDIEDAAKGSSRPSNSHNSLGDAPEIILPTYTTAIWDEDKDLVSMRTHMNDEIHSTFDKGMKAFVKGDWVEAKESFQYVLKITDGKDGPATNILKHMEDDYGGSPPPGWQGYRDMS